jgi:aminocarboxymuconate-semialdehyde decarboxylase
MPIDMHTHFVPRDLPDWAERHGPGRWPRLLPQDDGGVRMLLGDAPFQPLDERFWSPARRIADMDRLGIDMQVLSPIPVMTCYWAEAKANQAFARLLNESIAAVVAAHPARFAGMATVPLQAPALAIAELRHAREALGFRSVQIGTCPAGRELDDPALFAFFAACRDLGMAVFVHPIEPLAGRERMNRYYLPNIVGNVIETALAMSRFICGGVLERLPDLKICFAHAGGAFPFILGRLDKGFAVRPEPREAIGRPPRDYARMIYVDALCFDGASLRLAAEKHGAGHVLLGTDYPFALGEPDPLAALRAADLPPELAAAIADANVQDFLGR